MSESNFEERIAKQLDRDIVQKYILLLLNSENSEVVDGKTKLMKELFFISQNIPELEEEADFEADNYGPSSDVVISDLEKLDMLHLIDVRNENYSLTELGKKIAQKILSTADKKELEIIADMKQLFKDLTYYEALGLVYFSYPEMTEKSLVRKEIENKREKIALSLLKKGKVSIAKAAEIAGMSMSSFYNKMKKEGIKIEIGY
jgi:predicted HTH domain antitoxin